MTRPVSIVSLVALSGGLLVAVAGCAGVGDDGSGTADPDSVATDGNSVTDGEALTWGTRQRRLSLRRPPNVISGTSTATPTGSGGNTSGASSTPVDPATLDADAVAAAARTPDGRAIPQPAGPNGQCPDVVVVFGFWSCPTVNEQCSFSAGGATTACTCMPTSGEGQLASWVCS